MKLNEYLLHRLEWMDKKMHEAEALADKRLELLKRCAAWLAECPYCQSLPETTGMYDEKIVINHTADCELAKAIDGSAAVTDLPMFEEVG